MIQKFFTWSMITALIIGEIFIIIFIYKSGSIAYFVPLALGLAALIGLLFNHEGDKIINLLRRHKLGIVLSVIWSFFVIGLAIYDYHNPYDSELFISWIKDSRSMSIVGYQFEYGNVLLFLTIPATLVWLLVLMIGWTIKRIRIVYKSRF